MLDTKIEVYGSFKTGLAMPWSDIDIGLKKQSGTWNTNILPEVCKIMGKAQIFKKFNILSKTMIICLLIINFSKI